MALGLNFNSMNNWGMPNNVGTAPALFAPDYSVLDNQTINAGLGLQAPSSFGLSTFGNGGMTGGGGGGGFMDSLKSSGFLGSNGTQGWGGLALGAIGGLGSAFMGMKNYGLAKDSLNQAQSQFDQNYAAQRSTINAQMEDRQRARVAAGSGAESVDAYMQRNRIV